jgi:hypothetical protein
VALRPGADEMSTLAFLLSHREKRGICLPRQDGQIKNFFMKSEVPSKKNPDTSLPNVFTE